MCDVYLCLPLLEVGGDGDREVLILLCNWGALVELGVVVTTMEERAESVGRRWTWA